MDYILTNKRSKGTENIKRIITKTIARNLSRTETAQRKIEEKTETVKRVEKIKMKEEGGNTYGNM